MTEDQKLFLEVAKKYEELESQMDLVRKELNSVLSRLELGSYFQDPETNLVYKVVVPAGTFVFYKTVDYKRTAKEGERGGSVLSKKEAQEKGFYV
jgi:hypothetical protein